MRGLLHGFAGELVKLAAPPGAPPQQALRAIAAPKPVGNAPAPYQTPQTGRAGTPAPAPSNQIGASSSYMNAMRPQAMQSPTGAGPVSTYRPTEAFTQKAPAPAPTQPAAATPGGHSRAGAAPPSQRFAYETGGDFLKRRAGETLSNALSPVTQRFGVAAKPNGTGATPGQRQQDATQMRQRQIMAGRNAIDPVSRGQ